MHTFTHFSQPHAWQLGGVLPPGIHFEFVEGGGGAGGELGGDPGAGAGLAEPAVIDNAPVADPAAPVDPALEGAPPAGLTREEYAAISRESAGDAFRELLAQAELEETQARERANAEQQRQQANQLPQWDPFNQEVVAQYQRAQMMELLRPLVEAIQPALETTEQVRLNEGRDQAVDMLTGFQEEIGTFDHDRAILQAARYQLGGMAPEAALEQAARDQAEFERAIEQRAVDAWKGNAQNLADASAEPAGGSGAAADVANQHPGTPGGKISYRDTAEATMARLRGGRGVGVPTG